MSIGDISLVIVPPFPTKVIHYDRFFKLDGKLTAFNGDTNTTIADISTGALYLYVIQIGDPGGAMSVDVSQGVSRLRYYD